jgi:hypothetical protein
MLFEAAWERKTSYVQHQWQDVQAEEEVVIREERHCEQLRMLLNKQQQQVDGDQQQHVDSDQQVLQFHARVLHCISWVVSVQCAALSLAARAPHLQVLNVSCELSAVAVPLLCAALQNTPKLQQLQLATPNGLSSDLLSSLCDVIAVLPLTALSWQLSSSPNITNDSSIIITLRSLLSRLAPTLRFLQLDTRFSLLALLQHLSLQLRTCRLVGSSSATQLELQRLLSALQYANTLQDLHVAASNADDLLCIARTFASHSSPLRRLSVSLRSRISLDLYTAFFAALKASRIAILLFDFSRMMSDDFENAEFDVPKALLGSGLAQCGWLIEIGLPRCERPQSLLNQIACNIKRHQLCRRTCICLIALRKRKQIINDIANEIVKDVAKVLFDTRNCEEWKRV